MLCYDVIYRYLGYNFTTQEICVQCSITPLLAGVECLKYLSRRLFSGIVYCNAKQCVPTRVRTPKRPDPKVVSQAPESPTKVTGHTKPCVQRLGGKESRNSTPTKTACRSLLQHLLNFLSICFKKPDTGIFEP